MCRHGPLGLLFLALLAFSLAEAGDIVPLYALPSLAPHDLQVLDDRVFGGAAENFFSHEYLRYAVHLPAANANSSFSFDFEDLGDAVDRLAAIGGNLVEVLDGRNDNHRRNASRFVNSTDLDDLLKRDRMSLVLHFPTLSGERLQEETSATVIDISRTAQSIRTALALKTVSANMYVSGPGASALAAHTDRWDAVVLQLHGTKRWLACVPRSVDREGTEAAADITDADLAQMRECEQDSSDGCTRYDNKMLLQPDNDDLDCAEYITKPGDVLYLPKGVIHHATEATEEDDAVSVHLTFGLQRKGLTYFDVFQRFLQSTGLAETGLQLAEEGFGGDSGSNRLSLRTLLLRALQADRNDAERGVGWLRPFPTWALRGGGCGDGGEDGSKSKIEADNDKESSKSHLCVPSKQSENFQRVRRQVVALVESLSQSMYQEVVAAQPAAGYDTSLSDQLSSITFELSANDVTTQLLAQVEEQLSQQLVSAARSRARMRSEAIATPVLRQDRKAIVSELCSLGCGGGESACKLGCDFFPGRTESCDGGCSEGCDASCDDDCDFYGASCDEGCDAGCEDGCELFCDEWGPIGEECLDECELDCESACGNTGELFDHVVEFGDDVAYVAIVVGDFIFECVQENALSFPDVSTFIDIVTSPISSTSSTIVGTSLQNALSAVLESGLGGIPAPNAPTTELRALYGILTTGSMTTGQCEALWDNAGAEALDFALAAFSQPTACLLGALPDDWNDPTVAMAVAVEVVSGWSANIGAEIGLYLSASGDRGCFVDLAAVPELPEGGSSALVGSVDVKLFGNPSNVCGEHYEAEMSTTVLSRTFAAAGIFDQSTKALVGFSASFSSALGIKETIPTAGFTITNVFSLSIQGDCRDASEEKTILIDEVSSTAMAIFPPTMTPTAAPTAAPTAPTPSPSAAPTQSPTTQEPTAAPTGAPTSIPTGAPTSEPTGAPSSAPTVRPTTSAAPTAFPSACFTECSGGCDVGCTTSCDSGCTTGCDFGSLSCDEGCNGDCDGGCGEVCDDCEVVCYDDEPSTSPTTSHAPSEVPSHTPTPLPTADPTINPTAVPSAVPSQRPSGASSAAPTSMPTETVSANPTPKASETPTAVASQEPTSSPSQGPTNQPSGAPSVPATILVEGSVQVNFGDLGSSLSVVVEVVRRGLDEAFCRALRLWVDGACTATSSTSLRVESSGGRRRLVPLVYEYGFTVNSADAVDVGAAENTTFASDELVRALSSALADAEQDPSSSSIVVDAVTRTSQIITDEFGGAIGGYTASNATDSLSQADLTVVAVPTATTAPPTPAPVPMEGSPDSSGGGGSGGGGMILVVAVIIAVVVAMVFVCGAYCLCCRGNGVVEAKAVPAEYSVQVPHPLYNPRRR